MQSLGQLHRKHNAHVRRMFGRLEVRSRWHVGERALARSCGPARARTRVSTSGSRRSAVFGHVVTGQQEAEERKLP